MFIILFAWLLKVVAAPDVVDANVVAVDDDEDDDDDDDNVDDDVLAPAGTPPAFVPIIETFVLFDPGRAGKSSELMVNSLCALSTDDDWLLVVVLSLAILT